MFEQVLADLKAEKEILEKEKELEELKFKEFKEDWKSTPFHNLIRELDVLCKCPASKKILKDPTSVPSGKVYSKDKAEGIMAGKFKKFKEDKNPNIFRNDWFAKELVKLVKKYKKFEDPDVY